MGCLKDLIGIDKVCGATNGVAYIGDIGITEKELSNYLSADDQNEVAFLAQRAAHAERYVISDVLNHFRSVIRPWTFIDAQTIGEADDRQDLLTADAGTIGGIVLEVDGRGSNLKLAISRLSIYTNLSAAFVVTIRDLSDGSIITTASLAAPTAGTVTYYDQSIEIPLRRRTSRLLISHSLPTYYRTNTVGSSGCGSCHGTTWKHGILSAYGARIDAAGPFIRTSLENQSHTSGLGLTVTVECDHGAWLCEHKSMMVMPMLYKIGEECVKAGYFNVERINNSTLSDKLKERQNYFGREYGKLMDDVFKNMPLPTDRECFRCDSQTRIIHTMP